jgi:hypothetical protein
VLVGKAALVQTDQLDDLTGIIANELDAEVFQIGQQEFIVPHRLQPERLAAFPLVIQNTSFNPNFAGTVGTDIRL